MAIISESILSKHIIKPASQLPNRHRNLKQSLIDQLSPRYYTPLIFCYRNEEFKLKQPEISQLLRQSLSQILTVFYPLVGTIQGNSSFDCNDKGAEFVEARVHARLDQVTKDANMEELKQLAPIDAASHRDDAILLVKLNFFDCGGIAIAVCLSHKIADFASVTAFLSAWGATCRGETQAIPPSFDLSLHFPNYEKLSTSHIAPYQDNTPMKRLVFDKRKLEKLRQQVANSSVVKNPSRTEALSVFIWENFVEAAKAKLDTKITSLAAFHAVNLRSRTVPPIPDHAFGNFSTSVVALTAKTTDSSDPLSEMRAALGAVDNNYIKKVINGEEYFRKRAEIFNSITESLFFTSLVRFPLYGMDFGWGKPDWVGFAKVPARNLVIAMSNPAGDGIEAWLQMPEDFLQLLETNCNQL